MEKITNPVCWLSSADLNSEAIQNIECCGGRRSEFEAGN